MSEATVARLLARAETGTTAERAAASGVEIAGEPRVDRTFPAGTALRVGPFVLETLALPGHTQDGTGFRCRELDLLAVGDHLSTIEFPFVTSTAAYRGTLATLSDLLRHDPPSRVVPGHGPELTASDALVVAEADLAYLWQLHEAVAGGTTREEARAADSPSTPLAPRAKISPRRKRRTSRPPSPSASRRFLGLGDGASTPPDELRTAYGRSFESDAEERRLIGAVSFAATFALTRRSRTRSGQGAARFATSLPAAATSTT